MESSIRLLDRTGDIFKHKVIDKYIVNSIEYSFVSSQDFVGDGDLDWEAISAACEPVLASRTAREWDIGAEKEIIAAAGAEKSEFHHLNSDKAIYRVTHHNGKNLPRLLRFGMFRHPSWAVQRVRVI